MYTLFVDKTILNNLISLWSNSPLELLDLSTEQKSFGQNTFKLFYDRGFKLVLSQDPVLLAEDARNNPFIKRLIKADQEGKLELRFNQGDTHVEEDNPFKIYFVGNNNEKKLGYLSINSTDISKPQLLIDQKKSWNPKLERITDFKFLKNRLLISNAAIVVDPYLFSGFGNEDKKEQNRLNLKSLFDVLLPQKIENNFSYDLMVVIDPLDNYPLDKRKEQLKKRYKFTLSIIAQLNIGYTVNLNIVTKRRLHERYIITNYVLLTSGHGFNLFKNNNPNATMDSNISIDILPLNFDLVLNKMMLSEIPEDVISVYGHTSNRLLSANGFLLPLNKHMPHY